MPAPPDEILSERHLLAIGRMVVEVSRLELSLMDLAAVLMDVDVLTAIAAIGAQQFSSKADTLKAIANWRWVNHAELENAIEILDAAKAIAEDRNAIIHAFWIVDGDQVPLTVRFRARGKIERPQTITPPDDVEAIAHDALSIRQDIRQLLDRLHAQP